MIACCTGKFLSYSHKQKLIMSLNVIFWGLSGIAIGQVVSLRIENQLISDHEFRPAFTVLGFAYLVLMVAHDCLLLENW